MNITGYIQKLRTLLQNSHSEEISPRRDWAVLVGCVVLGLIISVWWNTNYFFEVVGKGESILSTELTNADDETSITVVEERFKERVLKSGRYQNEILFVDPSK
jgi:hypothetical protein